jgi:hypothetical protein
MKQLSLLVSVFFFYQVSVLAQEKGNYFTEEKDQDYLKNYKAPDFRFKALTASFDGFGQGRTTELDNEHRVTMNGGLYHSRVTNNKFYQGSISAATHNTFSIRNANSVVTQGLLSRNYSTMHNRYYKNNGWFLGLHDHSTLNFSQTNSNEQADFAFRPAFSVGHGRVEPVSFGRMAMDIERLLSIGNRLAPGFSQENRTALADEIGRITYKRYFDTRLARIYQLQQLDSVLQKMGVVNECDIVYFSLLQDAFFYSDYRSRLSGLRHEFGLTPAIVLNTNGNSGLMAYGFYSFDFFLPQSYAVQHDISVSVLGGYRENGSFGGEDFPAWLDASYTFGYYPTTRTYLSAGLSGGLNLDEGNLGYVAGTTIKSYYYISPRVRFTAEGMLRYGDRYTEHNFDHIAVDNINRTVEQIDYGFRLGLIYSIF